MLRNFNPALATKVVTDASRSGTGFCLLQLDPDDGKWHLVQSGSKSLNGPESRYAVCELEGLGIVHALRKCRHFLLGMRHFDVITDHKSLKGVFQKELYAVENVRLRRYREKLGEFNFTVTWQPGKLNSVADALSRFPVFPAESGEAEDSVCKCNAINPPDEERDPLLQALIDAAHSDEEYKLLKDGLSKFTRRTDFPDDHPVHKYAQVWKNLSIHPTGLILLNNERICVPSNYREVLLKELHSPHCGQTKTQSRARRDYWWPHFDQQIQTAVRKCTACIPFLPSQQQQPIINQNRSRYPMQVIGIDPFHFGGSWYLAMVDQFSGYPFVERLPSQTTTYIIKALKPILDVFGNPEWLICDNGRNLISKQMFDFLEKRNIRCSPASPYYPQSNGVSEACVKNVKLLLAKYQQNWEEFNTALLQWRDTPNDSGMTPSQMFLGRRIRSSLPTLPDSFRLKPEEAQAGADTRKEKRTTSFDKRPSKPLPDLAVNQRVVVQERTGDMNWIHDGTVLQANSEGRSRPEGRSYLIQLDTGYVRRANRAHIRPLHEDIGAADDATPDVGTDEREEIVQQELPDRVSDGEESEFEEEEVVENNPEPPAAPETITQPVATRQSTRTRKAPKSCHLCVDCRAVRCSKLISTCCHAPIPPEVHQDGSSSFHS